MVIRATKIITAISFTRAISIIKSLIAIRLQAYLSNLDYYTQQKKYCSLLGLFYILRTYMVIRFAIFRVI